MTTKVELGYAPRPRWHGRRVWRRVGVLVVLVCAYVGWRWGPEVWKRGELLYWQYECLNYDGGGMVVFEEEPGAMGKLLASGKGYTDLSSTEAGPSVGYVPASYAKFLRGRYKLSPVLFLHGRVSSSGMERLVVVECMPDIRPELGGALYPSTSSLASWKGSTPVWVGGGVVYYGFMDVRQKGDSGIRFFAGKADAVDPSHFTIGFEKHGVAGVIDGWLRDTGEVELKLRDVGAK